MDIILERILSLIPRNPDGTFVHGSLKNFANSIGLKSGNLVSDWMHGRSSSYKNYLYEISAKYNVSVEWLKGKTDEKTPTQEGERIPHSDRREILAASGIRIYLDADAKLTDEQLDNIVDFIRFQQEKNGR